MKKVILALLVLSISIYSQITDSLYSQQWNLTKIDAQGAWNTLGNYGDSNVVIAVLGYGININHEDLDDNLWENPNEIPNNGIDDDGNGKTDDINGWNFIDSNNNVLYTYSYNEHETMISGAIAAEINGLGMVGVASGCKILPIKFYSDSEKTANTMSEFHKNSLSNALEYIKDLQTSNPEKRFLINLSYAWEETNVTLITLSDLIDELVYDYQIPFITTSGNYSTHFPNVAWPGNLESTICIVATNNNDTFQQGRSGTEVDFAAPADYYATINNNTYYNGFVGTSAAAPMVAGAIALMLSKNNTLTVDGIKETLIESSEKVGGVTYDVNGHSDILGYGRINAFQAINTTLNIAFQNDVESENNIGHLLINSDPIPKASGWNNDFMISEFVTVQPEEETYETSQGEDTKFYKWSYTDNISNRIIINYFHTKLEDSVITANFKFTHPLTVRNYFEGGNGQTISFGEIGFNVESRVSPHSENAFIYNVIKTPAIYQAIASSIFNNHLGTDWIFQNWENGSTDLTRQSQISASSPTEWKAIYKGISRSDNSSSFTHNNQRKTVRTNDGKLHMVYESMGHVWYEMSTDDGDNWTIMNGGQPIDSGCDLAKSPSIVLDYQYYNNFFLVYQEVNYDVGQGLDEYVVVVKRFTSTGSESSVYSRAEVYESGLDMEPVIAANLYNLLVVYKVVDSEAPEGLNYILLSRSTENSFTYRTDGLIGGTYSTSVHPTLVSSQINSSTGYYYLAWQQYPDIKFIKMSVVNNASLSFGSTETPSYGSGNIYNYYPSVTAYGNNVHLVWQGTKKVYSNTASKVYGPITYTYEKKVNYRKRDYLNNWGTFTLYGNDVGYPNINNASSAYMYCWSENNGVTNKFISSSYSSSQNFTTHGKDIQAINHTNYDNMRAVSFNNSTSPYFFTTTETVEDITLQKTESEVMKYGREGIVNINEGAFFFLIGDILLDEKNIEFVEITDTTQFADLSDFNSYLRTKPFQISSSNNLQMCVMFGAVNDSLVNNILEDDDFVNFKMELVDSKTKEVIGIFDDVTYTRLKVEEYANISYELNTDGIGNREVEIRLLIDENIGAEYTLAKVYSDKDILSKSITKLISYQGSLEVTDYELSQNYPNPFNPSTTIKYQIPNDGIVSIKIYDITGQEIATLVNQAQTKGRYEVNFDASNLSSGVYFYRIQSTSASSATGFTKTMKMILLK